MILQLCVPINGKCSQERVVGKFLHFANIVEDADTHLGGHSVTKQCIPIKLLLYLSIVT